jgi:aminopeptidase N
MVRLIFVVLLSIYKVIAVPEPAFKIGIFENSDKLAGFYRLPNNSKPTNYELMIKTGVDLDNFTFNGEVKITIDILKDMEQSITLHSRQLKIENIAYLNPISSQVIRNNLTFSYDDEKEFLEITLPAAQFNGSSIKLGIKYSGILREDLHGLYRGKYFDGTEDHYYATTQLESTDARHVMPCYDEPEIRAPINVEIHHPKKYSAISNTKALSTDTSPLNENYNVTKFETTPSMQTYLLAFLISDFGFKSNEVVKVEQRVYAIPKSILNKEVDYALSEVDNILKGFEKYLGVEYPLNKMDHAAINQFSAGAMENYGMISYADKGLLLTQTDASSETKKRDIIELISHEYAHQFFGNLVSPQWWSFLWLNEGFANLMATFIPSQIYSDDEFIYRFHFNTQKSAFKYDVDGAKPLNFYIESPNDIANKFDTISYSKGASVLRMFQQAFGEDIFANGLKYYLKNMENQSALPEDLHRNLQKALDESDPKFSINVEKFMSTWENQMGYPTIYVEKEVDGKFSLTQARSESSSEIYSIPITYVTNSEPTVEKSPKFWMHEKTLNLSLNENDNWIVLNLHRDGYYKVKYSQDIQKAQINATKDYYAQLPVINRLQLFLDYKEVQVSMKKIDSSYGLKLLQNIPNETSKYVYEEIVLLFSDFHTKFIDGEHYEAFRSLIMDSLNHHLIRLGYDKKPEESENDTLLRSYITTMSCKLLDEDCLVKKFEKLTTDVNSLEVNELCDGFRKMNESTFESLAVPDIFNSKFLPFFTCSLDKEFFNRSLQYIVNEPKINSTNRLKMIKNGLTTQEGVIQILDLIMENIEKLNEL